jgi:hypothetical protein
MAFVTWGVGLLTLGFVASAQTRSGIQSRPPADNEVSASHTWVSGGSAAFAGFTDEPEIETTAWRISAAHSINWEEARYSVGFTGSDVSIDAHPSVPLPDNLRSLSLDLTGHWRLNEAWSLNSRVHAGLFGDDDVDTSDAFAVDGSVAGIWRANAQWTWTLGARFSALSDLPVLPLVAARWQPNEVWTVVLGVPRTEVAYSWRGHTSLFGAASFDGGAFVVDDARIAAYNGSAVDGETKLEYQQVRVGVGARHAFSDKFRAQFEVGAAVAREFDYEDREVKIEPDAAAYVSISLAAEF